MNTTVVLTDRLAAELQANLANSLETAGVLLASVVQTIDGSVRVLCREVHWVDESAYLRRGAYGLSIASDGYVHALGRAESIKAVALWLHTHPGVNSSPLPSSHDETVDSEIADLFRLRSGSNWYGALIIAPCAGGFVFSGHLQHEGGSRIPLDRLWVVGDRLRLSQSYGSTEVGLSGAFDRNVRAFGSAVQQTLNSLKIAVVGCGGTGSVVAEQLVRLGVSRIVLVDPDKLSASNVTRVYGSHHTDVGKPKVDVLGDHLSRIVPDVGIERLPAMLTLEPIARRLIDCDVIFGCTDDNAGRLVLSRMANYFLIPIIDCGILLTSTDDGKLAGIDGRVTILTPGDACLVCRERIDLGRAASELLTPEERMRRVDEGYAPALGRVEPAVVTFTTATGAIAVAELLERLIGYGQEPRPSEVLLRFHDREMSTNLAAPKQGHYCYLPSGKIGIGMTQPFLEQSWPS